MTQIQELPQRGRNIFKFDGPIGRLQFLKTMGILFLSVPIALVPYIIIYLFFGINIYTKPIIVTIYIIYFILYLNCL